MTDNEIIKALECCNFETDCKRCPLYKEHSANCIDIACKNALDLITRQQAIIEKSEKVEYFADKTIATLQAKNKELAETIHNLMIEKDALFDKAEELKAEIERLEVENSHYAELEQGCYVTGVKNIKAVAYKEFAERLKGKTFTHKNFGKLVFVEDIDNLVKEMVGEKQ